MPSLQRILPEPFEQFALAARFDHLAELLGDFGFILPLALLQIPDLTRRMHAVGVQALKQQWIDARLGEYLLRGPH